MPNDTTPSPTRPPTKGSHAQGFWRWLVRRLGFGAKRAERPLSVGVDLTLMQPRGATGGVKPFVISFLREIARSEGEAFRFIYIASPGLAPELRTWIRSCDVLSISPAERPPFDVLYAPFGRSELMTPSVPTVSVIVDLLHRDLPSALPIEEVNFRHEWFTQIAAGATAFQCISHYTASRLQLHYGVPPERCFVTHLPVHERLSGTRQPRAMTSSPVHGPFFFYPANFWPHKNHETLLEAYAHYRATAGAGAWPLVLTGHPDARMQTLVELAATRGLASHAHFLGHLDDAQFVALWRAAGALVYPSLHEGFGIPLLEAMAFGVPIIASNTTSLPEVGGDACECVDPHDAKALGQALRRISMEAPLRGALTARGRRRIETFSLSREAQQLATALKRAAMTGSRPSSP